MSTDTGGREPGAAGFTPPFFTCDLADAIPKEDLSSMEHPMFTLSTKPDRRVLRYAHGDVRVEITPSVKGLATVHDKDILIYCVSQLMAGINRGDPVTRRLHMRANDLLVATKRDTSGDGYRRLREAFERLAGTRIVTNIETGGLETTTGFGLIESWEIVRRSRSGRMISVAVTLSEWLYRAVLSKTVLTLSRDYFKLRKPLERRVYELARKHCGRQAEWKVGLETLLKKSGSASPRRVFRKMIRDMVAEDHLPDYSISMRDDDIIWVRPRGRLLEDEDMRMPILGVDVYEEARKRAPGWDVYALEADWRAMWVATGRPRLHSPDKAFLAYCAKRAATRPN